MQRLERLVVQVEEAVRFARYNDESHLRLALLLLDGAAELLLHRECERALAFDSWRRQALDGLLRREAESAWQSSEELTSWKEELESETLSKRQRTRIERSFDGKAQYLAQSGHLTETQARVLRKLHQYRNEAQHRDEIRSDTLGSAVNIYIYMVCTLMQVLPTPGIIVDSRSQFLPGLTRHQDLLSQVGGLNARQEIGQRLLLEAGLAEVSEVTGALSTHVRDRLLGIHDDLASAGGLMWSEHWSPAAILGLVQIDDGRLTAFIKAEDVLRMDHPVTMELLADWEASADALADRTEVVDAFSAFADLEDLIEPIESRVAGLVTGLDLAIQNQLDIMRGK